MRAQVILWQLQLSFLMEELPLPLLLRLHQVPFIYLGSQSLECPQVWVKFSSHFLQSLILLNHR